MSDTRHRVPSARGGKVVLEKIMGSTKGLTEGGMTAENTTGGMGTLTEEKSLINLKNVKLTEDE
jgi:hypothetical protein